MATSKLISSHLRRSRFSLLHPLQSLSLLNTTTTTTSSPPPPHTSTTTSPAFSSTSYFTHNHSYIFSHTKSFRYFSSQPSDSVSTHASNSVTESELRILGFQDETSSRPSDSVSTHASNSVTESELRILGFEDGALVSDPVSHFVGDSFLPIRSVISLLDGYHDLTGLPWWIVIASSTLALRIALLPWLILQLKKLKQIGELFPKLPPPFPPPLSGRNYLHQFSLFRKERKELGCPSFLWFLATVTVQIPCFILLMATIRSMSLNDHPGFDTGGILWFQDLTELPNGILGPILPILVAGLHFCNVQISFRSTSLKNGTGMLDLLAKCYRRYLQVLTLPLLYVAFYIPQGSLVYWVTNSTLTLIQQLSLQHPTIRQKLGLPDKNVVQGAADPEKDMNVSGLPDAPQKQKLVSAFSLSPRELVDRSILYLMKGQNNRAISFLRLALDKDPECYRALSVMGQAMFQQGDYEEATEYSSHAISKISLLQQPTDGETVDILIQASLLAGAALHKQGKLAEALVHFERVKDIEEPEDKVAKARYYEALVVLASVIFNLGRKDEAAQYLCRAAAYDPQYAVYLKNMGSVNDDFVGDLARSRRRDY